MVSLGSISGAVLFAVLTIFIRDGYIVEYNYSFILFGMLLAAIVIINHRANLKRIIEGNENRISFKKKPVEEEKKEEEKPVEEEVKVSEPEEIKIEVKPETTDTEEKEDKKD